MGLLDFVVNAILVLLIVRYFLEDYTYYGFGPLLQTLYEITEIFCKPLREGLGLRTPKASRTAPWIAVALIVVIRGGWRIFLGYGSDQMTAAHGVVIFLSSFLDFVNLAYIFVIGMLLASALLSKQGLVFYSSAGYQAFQENTFRVFQVTQGWFRTNDLWRLFWGSVLWIGAVHFVLASLFSLSLQWGYVYLFGREAVFQIRAASILLQYYYFTLLVAIIISWVSPDPGNPVVAVVRGLAEPYLRLFRLWCPWARVGMLDLSPIIAFFALMLVQQFLVDLAGAIAMKTMPSSRAVNGNDAISIL